MSSVRRLLSLRRLDDGPSYLAIRPINLRLDVPLLTEATYDHTVEFADYPKDQNWGPRTVREWREVWNLANIEFQAFLQRWLYFGVLGIVTKQTVNLHDFTKAGGHDH